MFQVVTDQSEQLTQKTISTAVSHKSSVALYGFQIDEQGTKQADKWFCIDSTMIIMATVYPFKEQSSIMIAPANAIPSGTVIR